MEAKSTIARTRPALLFVVAGPSGVGKRTVLAGVLETVPLLRLSVSVATRPPRDGELEGRDYWFATRAEFLQAVERNEFLEYAEYCDEYYGTRRQELEKAERDGCDLVLEIEIKGARQVRAAAGDAVLVMIAPPSREECQRRLELRGLDAPERIAMRMAAFDREITAAPEFDYVIMNDDLDEAVQDLSAVIRAERARSAGLRWVAAMGYGVLRK